MMAVVGICALCGADLADDGSRVRDCQRAGARARGVRATTRAVSPSAVLRRMGACDEARDWVRSTGHARFSDTWAACPRREWRWWLIDKVSNYLPSGAHASMFTGSATDARVVERAILAWWEARS